MQHSLSLPLKSVLVLVLVRTIAMMNEMLVPVLGP
jgi:hypothetical protein